MNIIFYSGAAQIDGTVTHSPSVNADQVIDILFLLLFILQKYSI